MAFRHIQYNELMFITRRVEFSASHSCYNRKPAKRKTAPCTVNRRKPRTRPQLCPRSHPGGRARPGYRHGLRPQATQGRDQSRGRRADGSPLSESEVTPFEERCTDAGEYRAGDLEPPRAAAAVAERETALSSGSSKPKTFRRLFGDPDDDVTRRYSSLRRTACTRRSCRDERIGRSTASAIIPTATATTTFSR